LPQKSTKAKTAQEKSRTQPRLKGKIPKSEIASRSANGKKASRRLAEELAKHAAGLPQLPKRKLRDIGELSFSRPRRRSVKQKPQSAIMEFAASPVQRVRVVNTKESPFRKICDLFITARDGSLHTGTAWFISPRTLVTAGHCISVFRPGTPTHGMVRKILVMPARNGEIDPSHSPFGWVEVPEENLRVHAGWSQHGNLDFDYGAIILPENLPLGHAVGVFGYAHFADPTLLANRATLSGYPDDVPDGTQWFETNPIRQLNPNRLFYDIFTVRGQSGSPVFFGNSAQQVACAIHNFGDTPLNSGVRINADVVSQLNAWAV
jgi:glutamyl endopeptidase